MKTKRPTTTVTTKTNIREALREAARQGVLSDQEEQILRMRKGIGVGGDEKLQLRGQHMPETRAQLARIEKEALEAVAPRTARNVETDTSAKARIIARLRDDK